MRQSAALPLLLACLLPACKPADEQNRPGTAAPLSGRQIYMTRCITCHQADGRGVPGICPPLENSPRLKGPPEEFVRVMLRGMKGTIVRNGTTYNSIMPSWRFDLNDAQIAATVNDLLARWKPGTPEITEDTVRKIREETVGKNLFPTAKELGFPD